jgi:hypothetical protein
MQAMEGQLQQLVEAERFDEAAELQEELDKISAHLSQLSLQLASLPPTSPSGGGGGAAESLLTIGSPAAAAPGPSIFSAADDGVGGNRAVLAGAEVVVPVGGEEIYAAQIYEAQPVVGASSAIDPVAALPAGQILASGFTDSSAGRELLATGFTDQARGGEGSSAFGFISAEVESVGSSAFGFIGAEGASGPSASGFMGAEEASAPSAFGFIGAEGSPPPDEGDKKERNDEPRSAFGFL